MCALNGVGFAIVWLVLCAVLLLTAGPAGYRVIDCDLPARA
jgi:hypothetical protein